MAEVKEQTVHTEKTQPVAGHHVLEIDQGNNAVLLDIGVDGDNDDAGSIKLAKDHHVR